MPALYTHQRFGSQAVSLLSAEAQALVQKHRSFFDMGNQGPDFLFYYHPTRKDSAAAYASRLHKEPGFRLFDFSIKAYLAAPSEEGLAYLYGMVGHYACDAFCHPFVEDCTREGICTHSQLEAEFDRINLLADGIARPNRWNLCQYLTLSAQDCRVFAPFYPKVTTKMAASGLATMQLCYRALSSPPIGLKRWVMRKLGHGDLLIPDGRMPLWEPQITKLGQLYQQALAAYPALINVLEDSLKTGATTKGAFDAPFDVPL